jgi:hypothetical protein
VNQAMVFICEKCGKRAKGSDKNPSHRLASKFKRLTKDEFGKGSVRIALTSCMDICPDDQIAISIQPTVPERASAFLRERCRGSGCQQRRAGENTTPRAARDPMKGGALSRSALPRILPQEVGELAARATFRVGVGQRLGVILDVQAVVIQGVLLVIQMQFRIRISFLGVLGVIGSLLLFGAVQIFSP